MGRSMEKYFEEQSFLAGTKVCSDRKLNIGLFGFGCVGNGLYDVLNHSQNLRAEIGKICVKDKTKPRNIPLNNFTFERDEILKNNGHDLVVELIDDADAAFELVTESLRKGRNVVSANKKMIAENFEYFFRLLVKGGTSFLYEAACGGSIPIIRTLEEYYDNELLKGIRGILNGSSNYILSKMEFEDFDYEDALITAQHTGFAESDPYLDVSGCDSKYKLCILTAHAFGLILKPSDVLNLGIGNITKFDIEYAKQRNKRIKLIAVIEKAGEKYRISVLPRFVEKTEVLGNVNNEFNCIEVEGVYSDRQFFTGKGAGSHPTGSAVLSDISAITYDYKYGYKKLKKRINGHNPDFSGDSSFIENDFLIRLYIRYNNTKDLAAFVIDTVHEEYSSQSEKYIIADVRFDSLYNLVGIKDHGIFICEV
jgi:homoserine dehydrogenase